MGPVSFPNDFDPDLKTFDQHYDSKAFLPFSDLFRGQQKSLNHQTSSSHRLNFKTGFCNELHGFSYTTSQNQLFLNPPELIRTIFVIENISLPFCSLKKLISA